MFGNLIGDFVKGRIPESYPPGIRNGIRLHRRIDTFAQHHELFRRSIQRLDPHYGLYRGVLVDLFYDHFLAVEWTRFTGEPLSCFLLRSRSRVEASREFLPVTMEGFVTVLLEELVPSYTRVEGIGKALQRISRRIRRPNPLAGGEKELVRQYAGLRDDFHGFLPEALTFVLRQIEELGR